MSDWRRYAGYSNAASAAKAYKARWRELAPRTAQSWEKIEQNPQSASLATLSRIARFLGVGCPLRMLTTSPDGETNVGRIRQSGATRLRTGRNTRQKTTPAELSTTRGKRKTKANTPRKDTDA